MLLCPDYEQLLQALSGPDTATEPLLAHLALSPPCPHCAARQARAREILATLAARPLPAVPAHLHRFALEVPRRRAGVESGPLRQFIARLIFGPGSPGPVMTLRGSASLAHRLHEAGGYEIDLAQLPGGVVVGQVLPRDPSSPGLSSGACLLHRGDDLCETELGPSGEFRFEGLAPGLYALILETDGLRLVVPEIHVEDLLA